MKDYRVLLFGIALILFGIACEVMLIDRTDTGVWWIVNKIGGAAPFVGIVVSAVGLSTANSEK